MEKRSGRAHHTTTTTTTKKERNSSAAAISKEGGVTTAAGVDSRSSSNSSKLEKNVVHHPDSTSGDHSPVQQPTTPVAASSGGGADTPGPKSEDSLSIKSSDSVTTSGEYEIVPEAPSPAEELADGSGGALAGHRLGRDPIRSTEANGCGRSDGGGDIGADLAECIADDGEQEKRGAGEGGCKEEAAGEGVSKRPEGKKLTAISPILNIEGSGNMMDLEKNMNEVIHELEEERTLSGASDPSASNKGKEEIERERESKVFLALYWKARDPCHV